jgi:hypothetical protein
MIDKYISNIFINKISHLLIVDNLDNQNNNPNNIDNNLDNSDKLDKILIKQEKHKIIQYNLIINLL